jgi:DNA-binding GntR family transcriptional regulator
VLKVELENHKGAKVDPVRERWIRFLVVMRSLSESVAVLLVAENRRLCKI